MNMAFRAGFWRVALLVLCLGPGLGPTAPGGRCAAAAALTWRADRDRVDAEIEAWPLARTLQAIASATGWQIYAEPDAQRTVTARFHDLKPAEALRRLLGELNFAVLPQSGGPTKLFVYRTSVHAATHLIQAGPKSTPARKPIPNELLVTLKPGAKESIEALARRLGAKVTGRIDSLNAYRLQFEDEAAAQAARSELQGDDDIASIENNVAIAPPGRLEPLAMSSAPPLTLKPDISPAADKVIVGLIDTPVQQQGTVFKDFLMTGVSLFGDYQPPADQLTHGTAVAETLLDGVARALRENGDGGGKVALSILPVDIYGPNETTTTFDVARGIYEALNRHANIINMSLGGETDSDLVRGLIQDGVKKGVLFFAAAGNTPVTDPTYPAADPGVVAVTAGDARGNIASYANRGSFVQAIAPGVNIVHFQDQAWFGTGTSFSSPWVAGWAAGALANSGQGWEQVLSQTLARWALPASTPSSGASAKH